jgi:hypothetical protein
MIQVGQWPWKLIIWLLDVLKCGFGEDVEGTLQCIEKQCDLFFCKLGIQKKSDLDEFPEMLFEVGELPWVLIIFLMDVLKYVFGNVDEAMLQGIERPCEIIFCIVGVQKTTWKKSRNWRLK